jgi:major membrane immunogen (membrane-anchored lipoprotein)
MNKLIMPTMIVTAILLSACGSSGDKKVKVIEEIP